MKTNRKIHSKIFFLIITIFVLLLAALSVGTTLGRYSTTKSLDVDKTGEIVADEINNY